MLVSFLFLLNSLFDLSQLLLGTSVIHRALCGKGLRFSVDRTSNLGFNPAHANPGLGGCRRAQRQSTQKLVLTIGPKRRGCRLPRRSGVLDLQFDRRRLVCFFVVAGKTFSGHHLSAVFLFRGRRGPAARSVGRRHGFSLLRGRYGDHGHLDGIRITLGNDRFQDLRDRTTAL
jgi:hypothetical protein